jgi:hypothetical protein
LALQPEGPDANQIETDLLVEIEWGNNRDRETQGARLEDRLTNDWWREHPR